MANNSNVLYISYDGLTDPLGTSQILPYIVGLSEFGYCFTVISTEKPDAFSDGSKEIETICCENNIEWYPIEYHKKPPILSTIKDIKVIQKLADKLHKQKHFVAVHCRSYIPSIIGLKMQKKYGIKFIFDMRGFWADERVEGNIWNLKKPHYKLVYKYFKKKEKQFLKNADVIVSLTHAGKQIMQKDWNVTKPIYVIPCAVDTELFKPKEKSKLIIQNSELTIGYLGSIGTWYMLDEMLDFFKVLLEKYPKAKFKFITTEQKTTILNKAIARNIDIEKFEIAPAKRNDVPKELSKIDIGIFFIKPTFSKKASSPTKQGEFMSMGIPVIVNSGIGDTDNIVQKYKSGILINKFDNNSYQKTVNEIEHLLNIEKDNFINGTEYFALNKINLNYLNIYLNLKLV